MKRRIARILVLAALGLTIGGVIALVQLKDTLRHDQNSKTALTISDAPFGGPLTSLVKHTGDRVSKNDFSGQYRLVFFGFTFCPAICPTELQKISAVLTALGPKAETIKPIFISVDPERDDVQAMKKYMSLFDPRITGLTGSPDAINSVMKDYKVYASKIAMDGMDAEDYMVDHSAFIYFLDPKDRLLAIYKTEDTAQKITADIHQHLTQPGS